MDNEPQAKWIDSHCHLDCREATPEEQDAVIARAHAAGVVQMITVESVSTKEGNLSALSVAQRHRHIYAALGVHPHDSKIMSPDLVEEIRQLSADPKVVAIGEAGLDYHYDNSPRDEQRDAFRTWIRVAREEDLPLVIHTRDAEEDTLAILREEEIGSAGAVIHCFTGSLSFAQACQDLGFYISIPGVVTFKNAGDVPEVARTVDIDRLLVETDSPFLAPAPHRGKTNEPALVVETAHHVASLRGVSPAVLAEATTRNARRLFRLPEID
jgi:TatD DNase family protein